MLVNAPLVDQLSGNDVNRRADCASASTASGVMALVPALHLDPGTFKDEAYGVPYVGPTEPVRYIPYAAADHVKLWNETGSMAVLIPRIIDELQLHHPVLAAIPSQWGKTWPGGGQMADFDHAFPGQGTHEVLFCDYDGVHGTLTAMNPWPELPSNNAFYQRQPVEWWRDRIVYARIDPMALVSSGYPAPPVAPAPGAPAPAFAPTWDAAKEVLVYAAHDGLPAITLAHALAYDARDTRQGVYPLQADRWMGSDVDWVPWSDGVIRASDKSRNWAIRDDLGGVILHGVSAQADALAVQLAQAKADASAAHAALTAAQSQVVRLSQQVADLQAAKPPEPPTPGPAAPAMPRPSAPISINVPLNVPLNVPPPAIVTITQHTPAPVPGSLPVAHVPAVLGAGTDHVGLIDEAITTLRASLDDVGALVSQRAVSIGEHLAALSTVLTHTDVMEHMVAMLEESWPAVLRMLGRGRAPEGAGAAEGEEESPEDGVEHEAA